MTKSTEAERLAGAKNRDRYDVTLQQFGTGVRLLVHNPTSRIAGKVETVVSLTPDEADTLALQLIREAVAAREAQRTLDRVKAQLEEGRI